MREGGKSERARERAIQRGNEHLSRSLAPGDDKLPQSVGRPAGRAIEQPGNNRPLLLLLLLLLLQPKQSARSSYQIRVVGICTVRNKSN